MVAPGVRWRMPRRPLPFTRVSAPEFSSKRKDARMRFARLLLPISILLSSAMAASPAGASTTVGQLLPPFAAATMRRKSSRWRPASKPATPYVVPARRRRDHLLADADAGQRGHDETEGLPRDRKSRANSSPSAEDGPRNIAANTSPTFSGIRIPVQAGDLSGCAAGTNCTSQQAGKTAYKFQGFETTPDPAPGTKATIQFKRLRSGDRDTRQSRARRRQRRLRRRDPGRLPEQPLGDTKPRAPRSPLRPTPGRRGSP